MNSPALSRRLCGARAVELTSRDVAFATHAAPRAWARLDAALAFPPIAWLVLALLALWPTWRWMSARLADGSDEPWGLVSLAALAVLVWRDRDVYTRAPGGAALVLAGALLLAAAVAPVPPLLRAAAGVGALCTLLATLARRGTPLAALGGLAVLSLPLLASLQFYAGFPLRVITAEASRVLLALGGVDVLRTGTALLVNGRLVIVDAPCAGVHMGWAAYCAACAAAAWLRLPTRTFVLRLPLVGAAVLVGNVLRNTALVVGETRDGGLSPWLHEAIGLVAFALVCGCVLSQMSRAPSARASGEVGMHRRMRPATSRAAAVPAALARLVFLALAVSAATWPWLAPAAVPGSPERTSVEWPRELDGRPLHPLALGAVEQRFADRFPGAIARLTDGARVVILRRVTEPTRMLHPATDCYRGLGYAIRDERLERGGGSGDGSLRRCFVAERDGLRLRVCERIEAANGTVYTDTSAWYWSALTGRSAGPWTATTVAERT